MIVRRIEDVAGTSAQVSGDLWTSTRMLLREDGLGFTMTETVIEPGMDQELWYKHHLEACFCVEGEAEVENLETGERHEIRPGTVYALDRHDRHRLRSRTRMRLICVFTPALRGDETHDEDGSYVLPED